MNCPINIALAADARYVIPLAACLRSVVRHAEPVVRYSFFIVQQGFSAEQRSAVERCVDAPHTVLWIEFPEAKLDSVYISDHVSPASYVRLTLPSLLPETVTRVLYLDSDTVIQGSLLPLWILDLESYAFAAVQDRFVLTVDSERGLTNYRDLGIPAGVPYCNAGVLLMDIARWRQQHLSEHAFDYLQHNRDHIRWWDQDVLNATMYSNWKQISATWNYMVTPLVEDSLQDDGYSSASIVHFATAAKPWHTGYRHPAKKLFFDALRDSPWSDWTPSGGGFFVRTGARMYRMYQRAREIVRP